MYNLFKIQKFLDSNGNVNKNIKKLLTTEDLMQFNIDLSKNISEQLYCYVHGLNINDVRCPVCNTGKLKFKTFRAGYQTACSVSCSMKTGSFKSGMKEKYGAEYNFRRDGVQDKVKQTNLERYGYENPAASSEVRNKIEQTCSDRYGAKSPFANQEVKDKIKKSNSSKYGSQSASSNSAVRKNMSVSVRKSHELRGKQIKEQTRKTMLEKYGVEHNSQLQSFKDQVSLRQRAMLFHRLKCLRDVELLFTLDEFTACDKLHPYKCLKCNNVFRDHTDDGSDPRCTFCYPQHISSLQLKVEEFLISNDIEFTRNDRSAIKPKELDIFIASKNTAVEINGFYWHMNDTRHIEKIAICADKNIKLINLHEDLIVHEWHKALVLLRAALIPDTSEATIHDNRLYVNGIAVASFDVIENCICSFEFLGGHLPENIFGLLRTRADYLVIDNEFNWASELEIASTVLPGKWNIRSKKRLPYSSGDYFMDCGKTIFKLV